MPMSPLTGTPFLRGQVNASTLEALLRGLARKDRQSLGFALMDALKEEDSHEHAAEHGRGLVLNGAVRYLCPGG